MATSENPFYDSVRGVVILVNLPDPIQSLWALAADESGYEPYTTSRWEDCHVVAGGKRPTTIVAESQADLDPRLFDLSDSVYRTTALIVVAAREAGSSLVRHLAWDSLSTTATKEEIGAALKAAYAESRQRCEEWDLVDDYHKRELSLSDDERTVLEAVCAGKLNKQIASELGVSIRTVEQRRRRVFSKMGVESAVPLADRTATVRTLERRTYRRDVSQGVPSPKMSYTDVPHPSTSAHTHTS